MFPLPQIDFPQLIQKSCTEFLDVLFPLPPNCPMCQGPISKGRKIRESDQTLNSTAITPRAGLCNRCIEQIIQPTLNIVNCTKCGKFICKDRISSSSYYDLCQDCQKDPPPFITGWAVGVYEGNLREAVHRLKYRGERELARPLGRMMAEKLWRSLPTEKSLPREKIILAEKTITSENNLTNPLNLLTDPFRQLTNYFIKQQINTILVPIPLHSEKLFQRNFNQAELLAREVAAETGFTVIPDLLIRKLDKPPQAGLSRGKRMANMQGIFCANYNRLAGYFKNSVRIILVDDVYTTGATIRDAIRALQEAVTNREEATNKNVEIFALTVCAGKQD